MRACKWNHSTHTPEYNSWRAMRGRCLSNSHHAYRHYGGRGIVICEAWLNDFDQFVADMGIRPAGTSLDRIDNDGPYSPENCRWATEREQKLNRSDNRLLTHNGETLPAALWAERAGVSLSTFCQRLKRMPLERAIGSLVTEPTHGERRMYARGCRCEQCRSTHNARMRDNRAKRKAEAAA